VKVGEKSMSIALKSALAPENQGNHLLDRTLYRFSVDQYMRMVDSGVLTPKDRVELLEGWVVKKMSQNPPHAAAFDCAHETLQALLPPGWRLREQKPIRTADSLPEPDLAIVSGPARRYAQRHPDANEIPLVIEVADVTLNDDRVEKGRLYARAGIPIYWIINFPESQVEVYTSPRSGKAPSYRRRHDYGINVSVPIILQGRQIGQAPVRELLP
jgi:Uma2 family endonuclease